MFWDSFYTKITPFSFEESSTSMPVNAVPVYIGSSKCILGLDCTGMQGAGNVFQDAYGGIPYAADLYVVGHGMLAKGINRFFIPEYWGEDINTLPYGWVDYCVSINGKEYDTQDILRKGALFSRMNDIKHAKVCTSYLLDSSIRLEIDSFIPFGTWSPVFSFRVKSDPGADPALSHVYDVRLTARLHLCYRSGEPVFDQSEYDGNVVNVLRKGHEDYHLRFSISNSQHHETAFDDNVLTTVICLTAGQEWSEWGSVVFSFHAEHSADEIGKLKEQHLSDWNHYYSQTAHIETGKTEEEYLFNHSLYLFHMAYDMDYSIQLGHPFCFPGCWQACTFWDTVFAVDALCRSNDRDSVDRILKYYYRIGRKTGKPYAWMSAYDGTTFLDPEKDNAPLVIAAVAMMAVRHYECFQDKDFLREYLYPVIESCSRYAADALFVKNEEEKWYIKTPVSNDVAEQGEEVNQTFTTLWFAVILAKAYEYGSILKAADNRFKEISDNICLEHEADEYLHSRGIIAKEWRMASWIPFLLYPVEGESFLDMDLYQKTLDKYCYVDLYRDKQNCWQPWTECIEAQSRLRAGRAEEAYRLIRSAMNHTYGAGYFSEIGPHQQTVGYPPYISAHGAFIAAYLDQFADVSIYKKVCRLFYMAESYASGRIEFEQVRCAKGLLIRKAIYRRDYLYIEVEGDLMNMKMDIRLHPNMSPANVRVFVNGKEQAVGFSIVKGNIEFDLKENKFAKIEVY